MNIFKESFKNVLEHKLEWLRVATGPILLWIFGALFLGVSYWIAGKPFWSLDVLVQEMQNNQSLAEASFMEVLGTIVYYLAYIIALVSLMINGYRYGALREGGESWLTLNLNWRFIKLFLYYVLLVISFSIYALVCIGAIIGLYYLVESMALSVILGIFFGLAGLYAIMRLGLTLFLIAIDQTKPIRLSWALLKGNVLRLVGLMFLVLLVVAGISIAGLLVIAALTWILSLITPWLAIPGVLLFIAYVAAMWLLSWAAMAKAIALVYKGFTSGKAF